MFHATCRVLLALAGGGVVTLIGLLPNSAPGAPPENPDRPYQAEGECMGSERH
jgi:hypothetical protein